MSESVYKVIEIVGTSEKSWEDAAQKAIDVTAKNLHDLRIAEVVAMDVKVENGKIVSFRTKMNLSFKYTPGDSI